MKSILDSIKPVHVLIFTVLALCAIEITYIVYTGHP